MDASIAYSVGSQVAHPTHGAGTITSIEEKRIGASQQTYYVIETHAMELMVPVGKADDVGLRPIRTMEQLDALLERCAQTFPEDDIPSDYKVRQAAVRELLKAQSLAKTVEAVRMLHALRSQRSLGSVDTRLYEAGLETFAGELALASGQPVDDARADIERRLEGMEKGEH